MSVTEHELALAVMDDDGFGCTITTTDEERQEARARQLGGVPAGDHMISMAELTALWAELKARGELWNGMTSHYLAERYGDRLYHVMGSGWFVRPARTSATGLSHQQWVRRQAAKFRRDYIDNPVAQERARQLNAEANTKAGN